MEEVVFTCGFADQRDSEIAEELGASGYDVTAGLAAGDVARRCAARCPDAVLIDLRGDPVQGLAVARGLRASLPDVVVVVIGDGTLQTAIEATRLGALYLDDDNAAAVVSLIGHVLRRAVVSVGADVHAVDDRDDAGYERLIGSSLPMQHVFATLRRLESIDTPTVLITGESGTGKDLVGQAIHSRGPRRDRPYLAIDCAAMPEALIESELFGHEKGAFTDARQSKRGLFEVVGNGVLFLDEIAEMSLGTQAKLLRALENRRFKRVGGVADLRLDAAVLSATNRDLKKEVKAGRFREDLYFRLNVVPIEIPPLRRRASDIEPITLALVDALGRALHRRIRGVTTEALAALTAYPWPGNVRELRNVVERMMILKADDSVLGVDDIPDDALPAVLLPSSDGFALPPGGIVLSDVERSLIEQALLRTRGNQTQAARLLGISRFTLRHRGLRHGLDRSPRDAPPAPTDEPSGTV